jgi:copper transport protein
VVLRRTLRSELILIGGVLAAAAVLTALSPSAASTTGPFSESTAIGPAQLELTVDPAEVGANEIHLYLFDAKSGAQYAEAREVSATASLPSAGIGPLEQEVRETGPGHYVIRDAQLGVAGDWELDLDLRVSAFEQPAATVEVPIR